MTPEEKSLLERTYALAQENNDMLRKIRRGSKWTNTIHILYWVVILLLSFGAYYFIQPYVQSVYNLTGGVDFSSGAKQLQDLVKDLPR